MRSATLSPDALFDLPPGADPAKLDQLRALPMVASVGAFSYVPVAPAPLKPGEDSGAFASLDGSFGVGVARSLILSGRAANPDRADEVTVNEELAAKDIRVGQRVQLRAGFWPDVHDIGRAKVVGIHRGEFDLGSNSANAVMVLGSRFVDAHRDQLQLALPPHVGVRLKRGAADLASFDRGLKEVFGPQAFAAPAATASESVRQAINVQRVAWTLLAAAAAAALLVAAGQAVSRTVNAQLASAQTLLAIGMQRRQIGVAGRVLAFVIPLGIAIGRWAWSLVADGLGVVDHPIVGAIAIAVVTAIAVGAANLTAAGPAAVAARVRPATILRTQ